MTLDEIKSEVEPYKGTLVVSGNEICRLVDAVIDNSDGEMCWVYDTTEGLSFSSVLFGWIPLKGHLPNASYEEIVRIWNLNNENPAI